jgi:carboxypeptidase C (cathepsin A)
MTDETKQNAADVPHKPVLTDNLVQTSHQVKIDGQVIAYTVTTGTIVFKEETRKKQDEKDAPKDFEEPKATIFFIAYTRDGVEDPAARPITFSFNGGPGSSSVWLHLGLLGPKRVLFDDDGNMLPPPFRLVENEFSLLDQTDLVFVDPVSTGFSRAVPGEDDRQFHGFRRDIESVGDFIRLYTTRYKRWASPKFLIGESYGTTRAAGLSGYLQERHGYYLNGIMLISAVLNFGTHDFHPGNDLPFITFLPSYAATAWYHKQLPQDLLSRPLRDVLDEVEAFAAGEYQLALYLGDALPAERRAEILKKLVRYTGLSNEYVDFSNLRINIFQFCKELLRREKRTVGRLDTRFKGVDRTATGETFEFDPSYANIQGPYTATLNDYVRRDLAYESDLPYEILTGRVWPWSYGDHENRYVDVSDILRKAISMNPFLKVYVANGYYDLATPYFATEYTLNHLSLDPALHNNFTMSYFESGHMMYIHLPSLAKLRQDLVEFMVSAISSQA